MLPIPSNKSTQHSKLKFNGTNFVFLAVIPEFCVCFAHPVFDWFPVGSPKSPEVVARTSGAVEEVVLSARPVIFSFRGIGIV